MQDLLSNKRWFARRKHPTPCQVTGLAIVRGDKVAESTYVDGREFYRFKGLAIICDVVHEAWPNYEWRDFEALDGLYEWLLSHLSDYEAKLCVNAAQDYWHPPSHDPLAT